MKTIIVFLIVALSSSLNATPVETDVQFPPPPLYSRYDPLSPSNLPSFEVGSPSISNPELQSMDFKALIEYVLRNAGSRESIASIMISKFQIDSKWIVIEKARYTTSSGHKIEGAKIIITDFDLAVNFVQNFGQWLTKIEYYEHRFSSPLRLMILINQYCPNLIESELITEFNYLLTKPFDKVKKLSMFGLVKRNLELRRLYPFTEEFTIGHISQIGSTDIIGVYPSLRKLAYKFTSSEEYVEGIVKLNPNIDSIEAQVYPSFEFFEQLSTQMPTIRTLKFKTDSAILDQQQLGPLYFDNIESLFVENNNEPELINLPFIFNQLKSFTFYNYGDFGAVLSSNNWLKSIPNGQKLREFSMPVTKFTTQHLIEYSRRFPSIETLTIWDMDSYDDAFIQFLVDTKIQSITIKSVLKYSSEKITRTNLVNKFDINFNEGRYTGTLSLKLR